MPMLRLTEQELLAEAQQGALVLTANKRSARLLRARYDALQRRKHDVWESPQILTWSAWLNSLWHEYVQRASVAAVVLSTTQEVALWEQIIAMRQERGAALQLRATAHMASAAWKLVKQYKLPLEKRLYAGKIDTQAFFNWAVAYERRTHEHGWTDEARLPDLLGGHLGELPLPKRILLHGFDRITPQQQSFLSSLANAGAFSEVVELATLNESVVRTVLNDSTAEITAAANWARHHLDNAPQEAIGIIVPAMEDHSSFLERALLDALHPDALSINGADTRRAFELSLGRPLADAPMIGAALRILRFAFEPLPVEEIGRLLRSPFLNGSSTEAAPRALLDAELRRLGQRDYTVSALSETASVFRDKAADCPILRAQLGRFERAVRPIPERLLAGEWSERIPKLLAAFSWPGERTPNSAEHQAVDAWVELLGDFAHLDAIEPWIARNEVASRLALLATEKTFQPENVGVPVQVLGLLEAAGSSFDHLWVMGLHEGAWPPDSNPNPLLPLALQRKAGVPAASSESQFEYAQRTTSRILRSARHVLFSYPKTDGESELRSSSLLTEIPERVASELLPNHSEAWVHAIFASAQSPDALEQRDDFNGPALNGAAHGGTSVFKLQAACPFLAFAELRLGAKELESPQPGIDARERGGVLHKALEFIWQKLRSQAELKKMQGEPRRELVRECVLRALADKEMGNGSAWEREIAAVERDRLIGLLLAFLDVEERRPREFTVVETEAKKAVTIGGLSISVKVDRIDEIPGIGHVVLDYKATAPGTSAWQDERPDEPQLPIYATKADHQIAGVAFAQVRGGDIRFRGITAEDGVLPNVKSTIGTKDNKATLSDLIANWTVALEKLAEEHRAGLATVTPKSETNCRDCHIKPICRIAEHAPGIGEEEEDRSGD